MSAERERARKASVSESDVPMLMKEEVKGTTYGKSTAVFLANCEDE